MTIRRSTCCACETSVTIHDDGSLTDGALAERWGARLAGAVIRRIAADDGGPDPGPVRGRGRLSGSVHRGCLAGDRLGSLVLRHLRPSAPPLARGGAAPGLLRGIGGFIAATLRRLQATGDLDALLRAVDPETLRDLWAAAGADRTLDLAAARSVSAQALELGDQLNLWAHGRPGEEVLAAYLARGTPQARWRDARTLAAALRDTFGFLDREGSALAGRRAVRGIWGQIGRRPG